MAGPQRSAVAGILLRVLPGLLLLGVFEAGLRAFGLPRFDACWAPAEEWRREPDPELGWVLEPGRRIGAAVANERGMRGPVLPAEKAPAHYRILYVGDSTCFGLGVALEESFAARASALVQTARPEAIVEYEIAAVPGYSSYHARVLVRRMVPAQHPDLVVLFVGAHNDHSRARYYPDAAIPERLARRHARWHGVATLRFLEALGDQFHRLALRKLRSPAAAARVPPAAFRKNLDDMLERIREAGAVALVLSPPFSQALRAHHPTVPSYREALRDAALAEGARLVDLDPLFRARAEGEVFLPDGFHFTETGHAIAARAIADAVPANGP